MMQVSTSAPGKILVAGEYAVLQGAPAICMAVDRRARVEITAGSSGEHYLEAPGYLPAGREFDSVAEVAHDVPLLAAVWKQYSIESRRALNISIDTRHFHSGGEKLGIGSSAAAAVALAGAFGAISAAGEDVPGKAYAAHRDLQDGQGSGADVACSFHGGIIEYRMHAAQPGRLTWPEELHFALLWSGRAASTGAQLRKLTNATTRKSANALATAAEVTADNWRSADAQRVLAALREYAAVLHQFDGDHQLGIFDAGHESIAAHADPLGVVYKPCGAGGGDFGIAVTDDVEALGALVAAAENTGFQRMDMAIDSTGLDVQRGGL